MPDRMWDRMMEESMLSDALAAAPDGPITQLAPDQYIKVKVRASTGVIVAYTPTHGLYDRTFHGHRSIKWEEAWQIKRI